MLQVGFCILLGLGVDVFDLVCISYCLFIILFYL